MPDVLRRNRALNGDEVAVDLLPEAEWVVQEDRLEDFLAGRGLVLSEDGKGFIKRSEEEGEKALEDVSKIDLNGKEKGEENKVEKGGKVEKEEEKQVVQDVDDDVVVEKVEVDGVPQSTEEATAQKDKKKTRRSKRTNKTAREAEDKVKSSPKKSTSPIKSRPRRPLLSLSSSEKDPKYSLERYSSNFSFSKPARC